MMMTGRDGKRCLDLLQQFEPRLARHADVRHQHLRRLGAAVELRKRFAGRGKTLERRSVRAPGSFRAPSESTSSSTIQTGFIDFPSSQLCYAVMPLAYSSAMPDAQVVPSGMRIVKQV